MACCLGAGVAPQYPPSYPGWQTVLPFQQRHWLDPISDNQPSPLSLPLLEPKREISSTLSVIPSTAEPCSVIRHHVTDGSDMFVAGMDEPRPAKATKRRSSRSVYQPLKEKQRLCHLNEAFASLQSHLPFIPSDVKLSKIKTLRFAINYIKQLSESVVDTCADDSSLANEGPGSLHSTSEEDCKSTSPSSSSLSSFMSEDQE